MRYIIIGAGAVGGTIGGCLTQAGHDVVLVARGAHLEALRSDGLTLATPHGTETLQIPAVGGPSELKLTADDALILAVKSQDTEQVLREWAWQPLAGGGGSVATAVPVVCAQNGVANEAAALRLFRNVYGMCVWLPATHLTPGRVEAQGTPLAGLLPIGRYPQGKDDFAERLGASLTSSRFLAPVSDDIMQWKYGKLLSNLGNAIEALSGKAGRFGEEGRELRERVREEARAVLAAAGIEYLSEAEIDAARGENVKVGKIEGGARQGSSSWQSLQRGTGAIEADFLNGEIVLLGRVHGVPVPVNETVQAMANEAARDKAAPGSRTPAEILSAVPAAA